MNKGLWIARKNYLFTLMKKVSDGHGGDDKEFFRDQFNQILIDHPDDQIEIAITCFEDMSNNLFLYSERKI